MSIVRPNRPAAFINSGVSVGSILGSLYHSDFSAADPAIVLNGGNVSSLPNRGIDGAPAIQSTAANQPAFSATSFNGGPGITFDGVNDSLQAALNSVIAIGQRPFVWVVGQFLALADNFVLLELSQNPETSSGIRIAPVAPNLTAHTDDAGAAETITTIASDTNRHLFGYGLLSTTTGKARIDGSTFNGTLTGALVKAETTLALGSYSTGIAFTNCRLARVILASNEPSSSQLSAMATYLRGTNFPGYTNNSYGTP